ncbi:MAG: (Fe-S)-binding protein [Actinomycetes bacterium]
MSIDHSFFQLVQEEDLNTCVNCGLCLPHCPTYRVTGEDLYSPRGRINLIRSVKHGELSLTKEVVRALDTCIQCMGCEPACPSGVQYHAIISPAKAEMHSRWKWRDITLRCGLYVVTHMRSLRIFTLAVLLAQKLKMVPKKMPVPALSFRQPQFHLEDEDASKMEVLLFTGCVMDAWYRKVHIDTITLLEALGYSVKVSGDEYGCCGALHEHAGFADSAARMQKKIQRPQSNSMMVVNSAGCSASLKNTFAGSRTVLDINELLFRHITDLQRLLVRRTETVLIQEPCHLRHVQGISREVKELLEIAFTVAQLEDDGLCCGAGGSFSFSQPTMAQAVRDRKIEEIDRVIHSNSSNTIHYLASANPGCLSFLSGASIDVEIVHPVTLLAQSLISQNSIGGVQ